MRCTGPIERTVATRTVGTESSLVLALGGPDLGDQNKAELGTHRTCVHYSFTEIGASPRDAGLVLKI